MTSTPIREKSALWRAALRQHFDENRVISDLIELRFPSHDYSLIMNFFWW